MAIRDRFPWNLGSVATLASLGFLLAAAGWMLASPRKAVYAVFVQDGFAFADAAYRLAHGQVPHVDFSCPLGLLTYVVPYWGYTLSGDFAAALPVGVTMLVVLLFPILAYVLISRLRWLLAIPLGIYCLLLMLSPLSIGDRVTALSMAMFYNRLTWVALTMLVVTFLENRVPSRAGSIVDIVIRSALLLLLFYMKATVAVVAIILLILFFIVNPKLWKNAVATVPVLGVGVFLIELIYPGANIGYSNDLLLAFDAKDASFFVYSYSRALSYNVFGLTVAAFGLFWLWYEGVTTLAEAVLFIAVVGLSVLVASQNTQLAGLPTVAALLAMGAETACRRQGTSAERALRVTPWVTLGLLVVFIAQPATDHGIALTLHYLKARQHTAAATVPSTVSGFVHFGDGAAQMTIRSSRGDEAGTADPQADVPQGHTLRRVVGGINLLTKAGVTDGPVLVFDTVNPFSYALGLSPTKGDALFNVFDHLIPSSRMFPPSQLFQSAAYVMVPTQQVHSTARDRMLAYYGSFMHEHFDEISRNEYWILYKRTS